MFRDPSRKSTDDAQQHVLVAEELAVTNPVELLLSLVLLRFGERSAGILTRDDTSVS